jgi:hypothetical protein
VRAQRNERVETQKKAKNSSKSVRERRPQTETPPLARVRAQREGAKDSKGQKQAEQAARKENNAPPDRDAARARFREKARGETQKQREQQQQEATQPEIETPPINVIGSERTRDRHTHGNAPPDRDAALAGVGRVACLDHEVLLLVAMPCVREREIERDEGERGERDRER